jgi:hypothetical protein
MSPLSGVISSPVSTSLAKRDSISISWPLI